jgi:hypothetical protein
MFLAGYPFLPAFAGRYLFLLFLPWPMAISYDRHAWLIPALGFAFGGAWMAIAWKAKLLRHSLLLAAAFVMIFLVVPIGASPLMNTEFEVQDRYAYLASAGACLAVTLLMDFLGSRRRWPGVLLLCLVLIPAAAVTLGQERVWQSEEAVWANALRITPSLAVARFELFVELARLQRPAEALQVCQDGLRYYPDAAMFRDCLGLSRFGLEYLRKQGRTYVPLVE